MDTIQNDPTQAGERATALFSTGDRDQYTYYAVHTRFDTVQWFVVDESKPDPVTELPTVIRQHDDVKMAIAGL